MRNFPEVTVHRTVLEARAPRRQTGSDSLGASRFTSQRPHSSDSHTGTVECFRRGAGIGVSPPSTGAPVGTNRPAGLICGSISFFHRHTEEPEDKSKNSTKKFLTNRVFFFQPNHLETCMNININSLINSFMDDPRLEKLCPTVKQR